MDPTQFESDSALNSVPTQILEFGADPDPDKTILLLRKELMLNNGCLPDDEAFFSRDSFAAALSFICIILRFPCGEFWVA